MGIQARFVMLSFRRNFAVGESDVVKDAAIPADGIHFVNRQHDIANAQERDDVAVPVRLSEESLARVDKQHR